MTIYISQGRYTAAAIKGMTAKPGGPFRGGRGVVRRRRCSTDQLVSDFGTLRLANHSGSTG